MDSVKAFNAELSSLYEMKPPISKAKMTQITKGALKGIKYYKHVILSVEKFIQKCRSEYKIPGLYIIDSIVRSSRHQLGPDKDVFVPRFCKNIVYTFQNLLFCPVEERPKIIRVLNLWQKNFVFPASVIQPLLDMVADPENPAVFQQALRLVHEATGLEPTTQTVHTPGGRSESSSSHYIGQGRDPPSSAPDPFMSGANDLIHTLTQLLQKTSEQTLLPGPDPQFQQLQQLQEKLTQQTRVLSSAPLSLSQPPPQPTHQAPLLETNLLTQIQQLTNQLLATSSSGSYNQTVARARPSHTVSTGGSSLSGTVTKSRLHTPSPQAKSELLDISIGSEPSPKVFRSPIPRNSDTARRFDVNISPPDEFSSGSEGLNTSSSSLRLGATPHADSSNTYQESGGEPVRRQRLLREEFEERLKAHVLSRYPPEPKNPPEPPNDYDSNDGHNFATSVEHISHHYSSHEDVHNDFEEGEYTEEDHLRRFNQPKKKSKARHSPSSQDLPLQSKRQLPAQYHQASDSSLSDVSLTPPRHVVKQPTQSKKEVKHSKAGVASHHSKHRSRERSLSPDIQYRQVHSSLKSSHHDRHSPDLPQRYLRKDMAFETSKQVPESTRSPGNRGTSGHRKRQHRSKIESRSRSRDRPSSPKKKKKHAKDKKKRSRSLEKNISSRKRSRTRTPSLVRSRSPKFRSPLGATRSPATTRGRSPAGVRGRSPVASRTRSPVTSHSWSPTASRGRSSGVSRHQSSTPLYLARSRSVSEERSPSLPRDKLLSVCRVKSPPQTRVKSPTMDCPVVSTVRSPSASPQYDEMEISKSIDAEEEGAKENWLPPIRSGYITVCSCTLWIGHLNKTTSESDLKLEMLKYGPVTDIKIVPTRGCAFVSFAERKRAAQALAGTRGKTLMGNTLKVGWAPGAGVKDSVYDQKFDKELGCVYIRWTKADSVSLKDIVEGGCLDEQSVPKHLKGMLCFEKTPPAPAKPTASPTMVITTPPLIPSPVMTTQIIDLRRTPSPILTVSMPPTMVVARSPHQALEVLAGTPPPAMIFAPPHSCAILPHLVQPASLLTTSSLHHGISLSMPGPSLAIPGSIIVTTAMPNLLPFSLGSGISSIHHQSVDTIDVLVREAFSGAFSGANIREIMTDEGERICDDNASDNMELSSPTAEDSAAIAAAETVDDKQSILNFASSLEYDPARPSSDGQASPTNSDIARNESNEDKNRSEESMKTSLKDSKLKSKDKPFGLAFGRTAIVGKKSSINISIKSNWSKKNSAAKSILMAAATVSSTNEAEQQAVHESLAAYDSVEAIPDSTSAVVDSSDVIPMDIDVRDEEDSLELSNIVLPIGPPSAPYPPASSHRSMLSTVPPPPFTSAVFSVPPPATFMSAPPPIPHGQYSVFLEPTVMPFMNTSDGAPIVSHIGLTTCLPPHLDHSEFHMIASHPPPVFLTSAYQPGPVPPQPVTISSFQPGPVPPQPVTISSFQPSPVPPQPFTISSFQPGPVQPPPASITSFQPSPVPPPPASITSFNTSRPPPPGPVLPPTCVASFGIPLPQGPALCIPTFSLPPSVRPAPVGFPSMVSPHFSSSIPPPVVVPLLNTYQSPLTSGDSPSSGGMNQGQNEFKSYQNDDIGDTDYNDTSDHQNIDVTLKDDLNRQPLSKGPTYCKPSQTLENLKQQKTKNFFPEHLTKFNPTSSFSNKMGNIQGTSQQSSSGDSKWLKTSGPQGLQAPMGGNSGGSVGTDGFRGASTFGSMQMGSLEGNTCSPTFGGSSSSSDMGGSGSIMMEPNNMKFGNRGPPPNSMGMRPPHPPMMGQNFSQDQTGGQFSGMRPRFCNNDAPARFERGSNSPQFRFAPPNQGGSETGEFPVPKAVPSLMDQEISATPSFRLKSLSVLADDNEATKGNSGLTGLSGVGPTLADLGIDVESAKQTSWGLSNWQKLKKSMTGMDENISAQQMGGFGTQMGGPGLVGGFGPNMGGLGPNMGGPGPNMDRHGPNMGGPGPNMGRSGPNMGRSGPNMGGPGPNMGGPGANMGGPGPNIGGPGPNMGGPGPNMGGPGPNMGGPGQNMGGPRPNMGGPGPNMGGPGPNMGSPGPNMGGHRPNMGGPGPNMVGHGPNMGGPGPNMTRSGPNVGGPRPNMGPGLRMGGPRHNMGGPRHMMGGLGMQMRGMRTDLGGFDSNFGSPQMGGFDPRGPRFRMGNFAGSNPNFMDQNRFEGECWEDESFQSQNFPRPKVFGKKQFTKGTGKKGEQALGQSASSSDPNKSGKSVTKTTVSKTKEVTKKQEEKTEDTLNIDKTGKSDTK